jgi:hypothetical protein
VLAPLGRTNIPEAERLKMYGRFNRPEYKGDLRAVILRQRRPDLYATGD